MHGAAQRDLDRYDALQRAALPLLPLDWARFLVAVYNGIAIPDGDDHIDALHMMPVDVRNILAHRPANVGS